MVMVFGVIQHCFNKRIHSKEVLNNSHTIMGVNGKAHLFLVAFLKTVAAFLATVFLTLG
jgi:hypothetical protein